MQPPRTFSLAVLCSFLFLVLFPLHMNAEPELVKSFIFGSRGLNCTSYNDPSIPYTVVLHVDGNPAGVQYDPDRGWGYEAFYEPGTSPFGDRNGFGIFGPFDDSANARGRFGDDCPEQIYDSFIGAKNFTNECSMATIGDMETPCSEGGLIPEGIIFKVDVPNGKYRFIAVMGDGENPHAHRLLAEDGGEGIPDDIGDNYVVLVDNFDQAQFGENDNFAHVSFGCYSAPPADGPILHNMDQDGLITEGPASSPTLEVTEGYIRFHQLQGNSNTGAGERDPNGGDMVLLEIWSVGDEVIPDASYAYAVRSIEPAAAEAGEEITVSLEVTDATAPVTVVETIPDGLSIVDNGGGTVAGKTLTLTATGNTTLSYTVQLPSDFCASFILNGEITIEAGCTTVIEGDAMLRCIGSLSATGGVYEQLVIGPVDFGGDAGANCADNGNFPVTDYIYDVDLEMGEKNLLVSEGDELMPDFGGEAGGFAVKLAVNAAINPNALDGVLEVWRADADDAGYINFNDADNIGDGTVDYAVYTLVYLENHSGETMEVLIEVGTDDAGKVLLNGDQIFSNPTCNSIPGAGAGNMITAYLLAGTNVLLTGITQGEGGCGVRVILRNPDGSPITDGLVTTSLEPPDTFPSLPFTVNRTIEPTLHTPGELITVTLAASEVTNTLTVEETIPDGFSVDDAGGGELTDNTLTFTVDGDGEVVYTMTAPTDISCNCGGTATIIGTVSRNATVKTVNGDSTLNCRPPAPVCEPGASEPELIMAFAFGTHGIAAGMLEWCETYNDPDIFYIGVNHINNDPNSVLYSEELGYGYEQLYESGMSPFSARNGFEIFGPFDESANGRNFFPDQWPEELYDSFIGLKNYTQDCDASVVGNEEDPCSTVMAPEGAVFRVDVPNGTYRFVAACGDPDNPHAHRILAEDGGEGPPVPPEEIENNYVVLVYNFDQKHYAIGQTDNSAGNTEPGCGVFARVGFDDKIPPPGDGVYPDPQFINMDEEGRATEGCANSPVLEVTQEYIRIHQLQANTNTGCGSTRHDRSSSDLVVLELWQTESSVVNGFKRGDVNTDNSVNIADAVSILAYLFAGGDELACADAADANDDGSVNIADAVTILAHLFAGAGDLPAPFGACGPDPTNDTLPECNYPQENC